MHKRECDYNSVMLTFENMYTSSTQYQNVELHLVTADLHDRRRHVHVTTLTTYGRVILVSLDNRLYDVTSHSARLSVRCAIRLLLVPRWQQSTQQHAVAQRKSSTERAFLPSFLPCRIECFPLLPCRCSGRSAARWLAYLHDQPAEIIKRLPAMQQPTPSFPLLRCPYVKIRYKPRWRTWIEHERNVVL